MGEHNSQDAQSRRTERGAAKTDPIQSDRVQQHLHLRQAFEGLSRCLSQRAIDQASLVAKLDQLRAEMLARFLEEESVGYFGEAVASAPWLKDRADALLRQHPDLTESIDRFCAMAAEGDLTDSWWDSIADAYADFYDEFDRHERDETALLQEAYTRDVGTDD